VTGIKSVAAKRALKLNIKANQAKS
jgi:hypothetical protein